MITVSEAIGCRQRADAPVFSYLRKTPIEHDAAGRLARLGYEVFRTDGRRPEVSFIGMRGHLIRFVCVRRRKTRAGSIADVVETYAAEIEEIRRRLEPTVSGDLWIWCRQDGWRAFSIYLGGIQETEVLSDAYRF